MYTIILLILVSIFMLLALGGYVYRVWGGKCKSTKRMDGKVVVITGATAGIGKYAALDIAKRGAKVIMACRNMKRATEIAEWIMAQCSHRKVIPMHLDVSDLNSVKEFSKKISSSEKKIDVLINNAGCASLDRKESAQGYELTVATNHHGHFLLTHLVLDLLKKATSARIINVSSSAHWFALLDLDDLHYRKRKYGGYASYAQSKLCNILFTNELSIRLNEFGITANSLHPGTVSTQIFSNYGPYLGAFLQDWLIPLIGKTAEEGAQTTIHLAVSNDVANMSGKYFVDCKDAKMSKEATDVILARELWKLTEKEVSLPVKLKI